MGADLGKIGILARREIEARIAGPLIQAFAKEIGQERVLEIVQGVIVSLARESGVMLREFVGGDSLEDFAKGMSLWSQDDAIAFDLLELTPEKISMNVTRCRYAEMYRELGMADLGFTLSCARDFALVEGFNPKINLQRTQTIMEGADHCDFRFALSSRRPGP
jgi:L-2-amino-thiazoline-4-carboxylic acid hydrolase